MSALHLTVAKPEAVSNETTRQVCAWIKLHKQVPNQLSEDPIERKLYKWLVYKRQSLKKGRKFYDSDQAIAVQAGYPSLFTASSNERRSNKMTLQVCTWVISKGSLPSQNTKDPTELKMAQWVARKREHTTRGTIIYDSDYRIANDHGIPNLFDSVGFEVVSNHMMHTLCRWIQENKRTPSTVAKDSNERELGQWLHNKQQAVRGSNNVKVYDSDRMIAEEYGLLDLLNRGS